MPWSGGSFTRTNGVNTGSQLWQDDRDAGTKIRADRHDTHDQDLADGINECLKKDGGNTVTGTIDFDGNKIILDGDGDTSITADSDDRIDIEVSGTDAVQIGHDATNSGAFLEIDPAAFTAQANTSFGRMRVGNTSAVTVPTGTTAVAASVYLEEPNLTATGTVTDAATLYIEGAPTEGADNHAILVANGAITAAKGADIASATTTDIGAATGNYVDVTGTTTITGLGTVQAGAQRIVQFDGALTLTHNASSLILPGGANITTAAGDVAGFVSLGSGNWKCLWYQRADGSPIVGGGLPRSYLAGLTLSNGTESDHDIDIAVGECRSTNDSADLTVSSAIGKQIDVTWASGGTPGSPTGGLSSSLTAPANDTWYHVFLGEVSGATEAGFDTSVTGANLATDHSFTNLRRIGSVLTDGSANILAFVQTGDRFDWNATVTDFNGNPPATTAQTLALTVPTGIVIDAILRVQSVGDASGSIFAVFSPLDVSDEAAGSNATTAFGSGAASNNTGLGELFLRTDTSGQIRHRSSSTNADHAFVTVGWIDRRGRDD